MQCDLINLHYILPIAFSIKEVFMKILRLVRQGDIQGLEIGLRASTRPKAHNQWKKNTRAKYIPHSYILAWAPPKYKFFMYL